MVETADKQVGWGDRAIILFKNLSGWVKAEAEKYLVAGRFRVEPDRTGEDAVYIEDGAAVFLAKDGCLMIGYSGNGVFTGLYRVEDIEALIHLALIHTGAVQDQG